MKCTICGSEESELLLDLDCGVFDKSDLYPSVRIKTCKDCGHVFNDLTPKEVKGIAKYYSNEYGPLNLDSVDKLGDRPGSDSSFSTERYQQIYELISKDKYKDYKILDVGCATGGFLNFLRDKGFSKLYGIDIIKKYVDIAENPNIKLGDVYSIPFEDDSFDVVVLDQVIEHLVDVKGALIEVRRVLKDGGIVCVGIPDASKYDELYFFDFYWFLMREHVQHFDLPHIKLLFKIEGFDLMRFTRKVTTMVSEKMRLPNLCVVFYLNERKDYFKLKESTKQYIHNQFKIQKRDLINGLIETQKPIYVYGIGREFLYLCEAVGLKHCNIVALIDDTPLKQECFTMYGIKISNISILKKAPMNSTLLITGVAHADLLAEKAFKAGYRGEIIYV